MKLYQFLIGIGFLVTSCSVVDKNKMLQVNAVCISDTSKKASSVFLTKDEKGNPVISWSETDTTGRKLFYLSFFTPEKETFSQTIAIPIEQNASLHEEGMPKIAFKGDGSILAVYETSAPTTLNQYAGSVHYTQSTDRGLTWTEPRRVHADTSVNGSRSFASLTRLANGEVGACWLGAAVNPEKGGRPVMFASTVGPWVFRMKL